MRRLLTAATLAALALALARAPAPAAPATKVIRVIYLVARDAARKDRAPLVDKIIEHNRAKWAEYGRGFNVLPAETIDSIFSAAQHAIGTNPIQPLWASPACSAVMQKYPAACTPQDDVKYVIFVEAQGLTQQAHAPFGGSRFNLAMIPGWVLDSAEHEWLRDVGSIGHELGHVFGHVSEPNCAAEGAVKSIMCNGVAYPLNRINAIDYDYLFAPGNADYFDGGPEDLFELGADQTLPGPDTNTLGAMTLNDCAAACLKEKSCTAIVHTAQSCTFRAGDVSLSGATPAAGSTAGVVKLSRTALTPLLADGTVIRLKADTGAYLGRCRGCIRPSVANAEDTASLHVTDPESAFVQLKIENQDDGRVRLKSVESGKYLARCDKCFEGTPIDTFMIFVDGAMPANTAFELWHLLSGKYALLSRAPGQAQGTFVTRCRTCIAAAYPDQVTAHVARPDAPYAQWTIEVVK